MSTARLPPPSHLRFQIKESGKKLTRSAGDGGGACRSQEVTGGGVGCVSYWLRHFIMSLPCHTTFLTFKSCFLVQAVSVGENQLLDHCWQPN